MQNNRSSGKLGYIIRRHIAFLTAGDETSPPADMFLSRIVRAYEKLEKSELFDKADRMCGNSVTAARKP